jgi:ABC-type siderophore export system fused ATPase/permease subunit
LKELRGHLTILAISHQQALVEVADQVYRISEGHISQLPARADVDAPAYSGQPIDQGIYR